MWSMIYLDHLIEFPEQPRVVGNNEKLELRAVNLGEPDKALYENSPQ